MSFTPEQHLDALVGFLRAGFQSYVDAEDATHTDGLAIGTILPENVIPGGMWPIPLLSPDTPALEVAIPTQTLAGFDLYQLAAQETLSFAVRVWQQEYGDVLTAVERSYRKSLRVQTALVTAVTNRDEDAFGDRATVIDVRSSWRADPTVDQRESYTSSLVAVFTVDGSGQIR